MVISVKEAATRTGLTPSHIRRMIRLGMIKARKMGWEYIIEERAIKNVKRKRQPKRTVVHLS